MPDFLTAPCTAMRAAVRQGLDIGWFDDLAKLLGVSGTAFATIVGIDPRTLTRRRREGKLTPRESIPGCWPETFNVGFR